jgi:uncharacterized Zn finger protein
MIRNDNGRDSNWWSRRWLNLLEELGLISRKEPTRAQIRGSRVQRLEVLTGAISATVRDRERGECAVHIQIAPLDDDQWRAVIDSLSSQALFTAQLLAGDMPPAIEETFERAHVSLLPRTQMDLTHTCSCCTEDETKSRPRGESACRPLVAVYVALGEMLNDDPWLLFRLRGRDRQQILRELREQRNRNAADSGQTAPALQRPTATDEPAIYHPDAETGAETETPAQPTDLVAQIDRFWGKSKPLREFPHFIVPPAIDLALLRRLGPPPFSADGGTVSERLGEVYHTVTATALAVAYDEPSDEE